jgi:hypothetical protein
MPVAAKCAPLQCTKQALVRSQGGEERDRGSNFCRSAFLARGVAIHGSNTEADDQVGPHGQRVGRKQAGCDDRRIGRAPFRAERKAAFVKLPLCAPEAGQDERAGEIDCEGAKTGQ